MAAQDKVVPFSTTQFEVCKTCSARRFGVCGALKTPQLVKLGQHTKQRTVKKGAIIQFDDQETREYMNIVSGVVKLTKLLADGRQQIVGLQFPPEFVGRPFKDTAILNAEAASDLEICVFPKEAIEATIADAPEFERRLLEQTLAQLDNAREWMLALGRKSASEKLASLLASLARTIGVSDTEGDGSVSFDPVLSRGEMADFLGLTIETVSREFTKFRNAEIIRITPGQRIVVNDMAALDLACERDRAIDRES